jgi:hypothetical protein
VIFEITFNYVAVIFSYALQIGFYCTSIVYSMYVQISEKLNAKYWPTLKHLDYAFMAPPACSTMMDCSSPKTCKHFCRE